MRKGILLRVLCVLLLAGAAGCDRGTPKSTLQVDAAALSTAKPMSGPCPPEMSLVALPKGNVCVDQYEAAAEGSTFSHALDAGVDASALRAVSAKGIKPQVNVSEPQAEAMCEAASKRLCTQSEWLSACRGPQNFVFPYGNTYEKGACNEGRQSPAPALGISGVLDKPSLAEAPNTIEPGGSFPACVSAYGIFDMHGNVHEWVSTDGRPDNPRFGLFLGGYFADANSENGQGCLYRTTAHHKNYHDYSIGFRCCKDPQ